MISFMVIGLPRSGTTWAANWLCTDHTHCIHDPLYKYHYLNLDNLPSHHKQLGVSCTGLWFFTKWLNAHPARKVILHRDLEEVNASLGKLGFPSYKEEDAAMLDAVNGLHVPYTDLFTQPTKLWEYLVGKPFSQADAQRHEELKHIYMQPAFGQIEIDKDVTKRLMKEVHTIRSELWPG